MSRNPARFLVVLLITVAACGGQRTDDGDTDRTPAAERPEDRPSPAPADTSGDASTDPAGPAAAVATVRDYYAAVAAGDFARAYAYWSGEGEASGQTFEEFTRGFAHTEDVRVRSGDPGRVEPAAGSRYVEVPVSVRARTTAGAQQCFRGTYVLRRSVVPGATEEQRLWRIHSAELTQAHVAACADTARSPAADTAAAVVTALGERLASVSLLAPPDVLRRDLRTHYAPLVTPELLASWLDDPASAPGGDVSSPWPDRIEIDALDPLGDGRFRATGAVIYVSSTEAGTDASADRRPIVLEIIRVAGGWRIARVAID